MTDCGRSDGKVIDEELYNELAYYTLAHPAPTFIHQHVVDAYAAQHATETTKPITIVFALVGLYLYLEKNYSGKQVQKAHMQLAKRRKAWTRPDLPAEFGSVVISDVVSVSAGEPRDAPNSRLVCFRLGCLARFPR
jgi:hypothetical protein